MSKKRFVQQVMIRSLPAIDKIPEAIGYAESLWDALSTAGYGEATTALPRETKDWYKSLSEQQKKYFTLFWAAFKYKHGRDGAAMRWAQLGELSDGAYKNIIKAAESEGLRQLPKGQSRMMAQGWLAEKRYADYQATQPTKTQHKNHKINTLNAELNGIKILYNQSGTEALAQQIAKLEQAIDDARRK